MYRRSMVRCFVVSWSGVVRWSFVMLRGGVVRWSFMMSWGLVMSLGLFMHWGFMMSNGLMMRLLGLRSLVMFFNVVDLGSSLRVLGSVLLGRLFGFLVMSLHWFFFSNRLRSFFMFLLVHEFIKQRLGNLNILDMAGLVLHNWLHYLSGSLTWHSNVPNLRLREMWLSRRNLNISWLADILGLRSVNVRLLDIVRSLSIKWLLDKLRL